MPNVVPGYTQPIQMRVEELISGVRATLALKLYGEDLEELDRISAQLKDRRWPKCPGWPTCRWKPTWASRRSRSRSNREELARHGMNAEEVLTIVRNGLGGEPVSVLLDGVKRFDIAVRLSDEHPQLGRGLAPDPVANFHRRGGAACRRWPKSAWPKAIPSFVASSCSATR